MAIQTVGVIGARGKGPQVVKACVATGFTVTLVDQDQEALEQCVAQVLAQASPADQAILKKRIACSTQVADFHGDDLVIVANAADVDLPLLQRTEAALGSYAVIAIDAPSATIDTLAQGLKRPALLVGMGFSETAATLPRGRQTSAETLSLCEVFIHALGLTQAA